MMIIALLPFFGAQTASGQTTPVDRYVQMGLRNNLALQSQEMDVDRSRLALIEAKRSFMPTVKLQARYSRARGGRTILFPAGDLLNPVYSTLNQLLSAQGAGMPFPTLENEVIPFLREREQDTHVRVVQPIIQPALFYNKRIKENQYASDVAAFDSFQRDLVADIKTAYFSYLKTERAVSIYRTAVALVSENLRVNERLFDRGQVTRDAISRSEAEVLAIRQALSEAERDRKLARSYVNFLINRPLADSLEQISDADLASLAAKMIADVGDIRRETGFWVETALERRAEISRLESGLKAATAGRNLERSGRIPGLSFVLDVGVQGEDYRLDADSDYWMASAVLNWTLFDGLQRRARIERAERTRRQLVSQRNALEKQIELQVIESAESVHVAGNSLVAAEKRLQTARLTYRLVARRHEQGMANQVALLDARTTLTNAELNLAVTRADLLIRLAELERATGRYPLS